MNNLINHCLISAFDTYKDYLFEYIGEIGTNEEIQEHIDYLSYKLFEDCSYEEIIGKVSDLINFTSLHSNLYESDGAIKHTELGYAVIARHKNKTLILDGNHRKNTYSNIQPNLKIVLIIVDVFLP